MSILHALKLQHWANVSPPESDGGRSRLPPAAPAHLPYLDGWRGCAILGVLIGHFFFDFGIKTLAIFGVEFFFVLSGRLMADIVFIRNTPLPTFFFRRFSRIYPALLVYVIIETTTFRIFTLRAD